MSLEAFISGKCAVTSSGVIVPNSNVVERRRADENSLETISSSTSSSRRRRQQQQDPPTADDSDYDINNNNRSNNRSNNSSGRDANTIILAERTSSLINSYRDYVSGLDGYDIEELMISRDNDNDGDHHQNQNHGSSSSSSTSSSALPRRAVGAVSSNNNTNNNLRDYRQSMENSPPSPLLRGWDYNSNNKNNSNQNFTASAMSNRCDYEPSPYPDYNFDEEINHHDSEEKKYHYTHPIYHSKKFKRSLVVGVLVAIVALIGWGSSAASSSSNERKKDLDLENALNHFEMKTPTTVNTTKEGEEEEEKVDGQSANIIMTKEENAKEGEEEEADKSVGAGTSSSEEEIESVTRHILCCSSSPASSSSSSSSSASSSSSSKISAKTEYLLAESHHPIWYNRSDGWTGTTWQEAREFCLSRGNEEEDDGPVVELCPYEVYCPTGPHHIPYGGYRVESTSSSSSSSNTNIINSRAPISDFPNGWVQVGSASACVQYSMVGPSSSSIVVENNPQDANNEDALDIIEEIVHDISTVNEVVPKDNDDDSHAVVDIVEDKDITTISSETGLQSDSQVVVSTEATATSIIQPFDMTSTLHRKFKPFWLSSNDGWNGGSYDDAVEFCNSIRGKQLCPYSVMCPHGPKNIVMGGYRKVEFEVDGEQYAPILGGENHWVMIGNMERGGESSKCMTHRQLEGKAPEWGLNEDRKDLKKYIMCCTVN